MPASTWFEVIDAGHGVTIIREPLGDDDVKSYLVEGARDVAVLDTGMGIDDFRGLVAQRSDRQPIVLHSHSHWDHIGDSYKFERVLIHASEADDLRRGAEWGSYSNWFPPEFIAAHPLPATFDPATAGIPGCEPSGLLRHGDSIDLGGRRLEVFHTPGHSPGGITLLDREQRLLFPGDAINFGTLYLFFEGCDPAAYRATLNLLADLAPHVDAVYPSHGGWPMSPADLLAARDGYEEVWAGRPPDATELVDVAGTPTLLDVHDVGDYRYLLAPGSYGERESPR